MYEYLEHQADIGIRASGASLEQAFSEGAKAMFNAMADIKTIATQTSVDISCDAPDEASLFIEWLNALLAAADTKDLLFSKFDVKIEKKDGSLNLTARAVGEPLDKGKHKLKIEVKAATYSGLKFEEKEGKYYLTCVLDI